MKNLLIRNGNIMDIEDFSNLIIYTGKDFFYSLFGNKAKKIFKNLYIEKNNQFSFEFTNFVEIDNKICGMVLSYSYEEKKKITLFTGYLLIKNIKFEFIKNFSYFYKAFSKLGLLKNNEYYISNIAIYPQFRGLGIGSKLLYYTENLAKEKGCNKLVLEVEKENLRAINIYKKFGLKIEKEFSLNLKNKKFIFYRMNKDLKI